MLIIACLIAAYIYIGYKIISVLGVVLGVGLIAPMPPRWKIAALIAAWPIIMLGLSWTDLMAYAASIRADLVAFHKKAQERFDQCLQRRS